MGASRHKTARDKEVFLEAYRRLANLTDAAKATGVNRDTPYTWMEKDPEFRAKCEQAKIDSAPALEERLRDVAAGNVTEDVWYRGKVVGKKVIVNVPAILSLLEANHPEKFGKKIEQTHKGDATNPVVVYELPRNGREASAE